MKYAWVWLHSIPEYDFPKERDDCTPKMVFIHIQLEVSFPAYVLQAGIKLDHQLVWF